MVVLSLPMLRSRAGRELAAKYVWSKLAEEAMFFPQRVAAQAMKLTLKALAYFEGGDLTTLGGGQKQFLSSAATRLRHIPGIAILSRSSART